jgi:crotonobetainyl-CoA:carnitine CoA-transferase CaiB-like acyl-CoA transferase
MHQDPAQLLAALHGANVPATRAMSSLDLLGDEFLWASGAFRSVTDSLGRERPVIGPGWRITPDEADISRGAPLLGEHNGYVYTELLGLSQAELDDLIARKVVD